jgi:hypothetical protein
MGESSFKVRPKAASKTILLLSRQVTKRVRAKKGVKRAKSFHTMHHASLARYWTSAGQPDRPRQHPKVLVMVTIVVVINYSAILVLIRLSIRYVRTNARPVGPVRPRVVNLGNVAIFGAIEGLAFCVQGVLAELEAIPNA